MTKRWISVAQSIVICVACASLTPSSEPTPEKSKRLFQADFDHTWSALLQALNTKNLPISAAQISSGVIVTDVVTAPVPSPLFMTAYSLTTAGRLTQGRYYLEIAVQPLGNQTEVRINGHFEGYYKGIIIQGTLSPVAPPAWRPQPSTGVIESELFDEINHTLTRSKAPN